MPVARQYTLEKLFEILRDYADKSGRRITLEYVLFKGINDSERDAKNLVALTRGFPCFINLIQYNPLDTLALESPANSQIVQFKHWLERDGKPVSIRYKRGRDISAACGQLKQQSI